MLFQAWEQENQQSLNSCLRVTNSQQLFVCPSELHLQSNLLRTIISRVTRTLKAR